MAKPQHAGMAITRPASLPILTAGISAVATLIAEAAASGDPDEGTIADAAFLIADLARLVEAVVEGCHE